MHFMPLTNKNKKINKDKNKKELPHTLGRQPWPIIRPCSAMVVGVVHLAQQLGLIRLAMSALLVTGTPHRWHDLK
jgi:hypothetical protein